MRRDRERRKKVFSLHMRGKRKASNLTCKCQITAGEFLGEEEKIRPKGEDVDSVCVYLCV